MVIYNTCQHNTLYVVNPTYFAPKPDQSQNSKKFPNSEKRIAPFETRNNGKTVPFELSQRKMFSMLWFNFILVLNCIFLCFKLISIYITIPQNKGK